MLYRFKKKNGIATLIIFYYCLCIWKEYVRHSNGQDKVSVLENVQNSKFFKIDSWPIQSYIFVLTIQGSPGAINLNSNVLLHRSRLTDEWS